MNTIQERLKAVRQLMQSKNIAACIIPGTDPHASEYIADHWKEREWISGFDGSAGTAVVTLDKAGLWTDSRYFLQGAEQLAGSGMDLMKQGLPETAEIIPWLGKTLQSGDQVAVNPQMFSVNAYQSMHAELSLHGIQLVGLDIIREAWTNRPAIPQNPVFIFDTQYSGKTVEDKIKDLRTALGQQLCDTFVVTALDDLAWLFNLRGKDVDYNPVYIAYALIQPDQITLFIDAKKLSGETSQYLKDNKIVVKDYGQIDATLQLLPHTSAIYVDGGKMNYHLFKQLPGPCEKRFGMSPVFKLKSIKNDIEISGIRNAMKKDAVALTRFLMWFEKNLNSGQLSEISISEKLYDFRAKQELFYGESFGTICGFAGHGAIVHYKATPASDAKITPDNILLLDSGGQYFDGTTDITRTFTLGNATEHQKTDYTLVLKGHIGIATACFPTGTRGSQLDILARKALWDRGLNYGHGTGHGVGHFLNVHEGPQSIRMDENPTVLQPGMIISNEPGMYRTNGYGIRIENLVLVTEAEKTEFGQFLAFETLTLFPIDKNLIDKSLLNEHEIHWLNTYHQKVFDTVASSLNEEEIIWLKDKCSVI